MVNQENDILFFDDAKTPSQERDNIDNEKLTSLKPEQSHGTPETISNRISKSASYEDDEDWQGGPWSNDEVRYLLRIFYAKTTNKPNVVHKSEVPREE